MIEQMVEEEVGRRTGEGGDPSGGPGFREVGVAGATERLDARERAAVAALVRAGVVDPWEAWSARAQVHGELWAGGLATMSG
ncbi:hypothetical protein SAMN05445756_0335 [Kytococcus aerolatus]|uniref:Uncharacterized protein n=1 Tax=Kytococcus aerolatus TaxID=592308 RepID=A0A212T4N1_9MICO|nr:hypothetical protein [Kytococcus aerolatus]SNC60714.1 hypothetical protein SAMN05445756_0335 [Kytococcus aerolatus]